MCVDACVVRVFMGACVGVSVGVRVCGCAGVCGGVGVVACVGLGACVFHVCVCGFVCGSMCVRV